MYKLNYYVPVAAKEETKQALFDIGVGMFCLLLVQICELPCLLSAIALPRSDFFHISLFNYDFLVCRFYFLVTNIES